VSGYLAFGSPDLIPQIFGTLSAFGERRAGARPTRVHQSTHSAPDMPVGEVGGVGPPVRNVVSGDFPSGWRLLVLHEVLRQSSQESSGLVPESQSTRNHMVPAGVRGVRKGTRAT